MKGKHCGNVSVRLAGEEKSLRASIIKKAKTCGCKIGRKKGIVPTAAIEAAKEKIKLI